LPVKNNPTGSAAFQNAVWSTNLLDTTQTVTGYSNTKSSGFTDISTIAVAGITGTVATALVGIRAIVNRVDVGGISTPDFQTQTKLTLNHYMGDYDLYVTSVTGFAIGDVIGIEEDDTSLTQTAKKMKYESHTIRSIDTVNNTITICSPLEFNLTSNAFISKAGTIVINGTRHDDAAQVDTVYVIHSTGGVVASPFHNFLFTFLRFKTITSIVSTGFNGTVEVYEAMDFERISSYDTNNSWGLLQKGAGTAGAVIRSYCSKDEFYYSIGLDQNNASALCFFIIQGENVSLISITGGSTETMRIKAENSLAYVQFGRKVGDIIFCGANIHYINDRAKCDPYGTNLDAGHTQIYGSSFTRSWDWLETIASPAERGGEMKLYQYLTCQLEIYDSLMDNDRKYKAQEAANLLYDDDDYKELKGIP